MMVANLLLLGSDAGFVNLYFRDYYMSKFFKKSFQSLKPDMLLVLGDVSAKGSELSRSKWLSVFHQFDRILGPFLELPLHVILGDRDVGECCDLDAKSVNWVARNFPGLDSSGCGAFEISNISFVSLNAVPLLCGNNKLRFGVEKVVERKSVDLQMKTKSTAETKDESGMSRELSYGFGWRENAMTSGSGPVLVLHFPLYRPGNTYSREGSAFKSTIHPSGHSSNFVESRCISVELEDKGMVLNLLSLYLVPMAKLLWTETTSLYYLVDHVGPRPSLLMGSWEINATYLGVGLMIYHKLYHQMLLNTFFKLLNLGLFLVLTHMNLVITLTQMGPVR
ncbi:Calcineurin-like metallo-phosphoesterase superfamily protein, putative isoform 2 [Theobroma cacao]|uniref:Calcineurin-like metallo-phosphoesterase superfamily protein, putative isoform 2 n=1 Tax=Theobroma cacao TaxID=3641 RepID=A0A061FNE5_THECC|nr:Calcineurin-like metallo-phosphoesterase superfamily protein, putative isoform 2 [Theobroma cacao]